MGDELTESMKRIAERLEILEQPLAQPESKPKHRGQIILVVPVAAVITIASCFQLYSEYKAAKGQPNVVIDNRPMESLMQDIRELKDTQKKNEIIMQGLQENDRIQDARLDTIISMVNSIPGL